ncbi:MAG: FeoB-associated Cys-rich membrane protein [Clostridia bacterium]|nr:FeoB-associated Cys-rich membrane protein [Clostridia bacterium]
MNIMDIVLTGLIIVALFMAGRQIYRHRGNGCPGCCTKCDQFCSARHGK